MLLLIFPKEKARTNCPDLELTTTHEKTSYIGKVRKPNGETQANNLASVSSHAFAQTIPSRLNSLLTGYFDALLCYRMKNLGSGKVIRLDFDEDFVLQVRNITGQTVFDCSRLAEVVED